MRLFAAPTPPDQSISSTRAAALCASAAVDLLQALLHLSIQVAERFLHLQRRLRIHAMLEGVGVADGRTGVTLSSERMGHKLTLALSVMTTFMQRCGYAL
jgi:hypothetical protein